jgi:hypothetical protein
MQSDTHERPDVSATDLLELLEEHSRDEHRYPSFWQQPALRAMSREGKGQTIASHHATTMAMLRAELRTGNPTAISRAMTDYTRALSEVAHATRDLPIYVERGNCAPSYGQRYDLTHLVDLIRGYRYAHNDYPQGREAERIGAQLYSAADSIARRAVGSTRQLNPLPTPAELAATLSLQRLLRQREDILSLSTLHDADPRFQNPVREYTDSRRTLEAALRGRGQSNPDMAMRAYTTAAMNLSRTLDAANLGLPHAQSAYHFVANVRNIFQHIANIQTHRDSPDADMTRLQYEGPAGHSAGTPAPGATLGDMLQTLGRRARL